MGTILHMGGKLLTAISKFRVSKILRKLKLRKTYLLRWSFDLSVNIYNLLYFPDHDNLKTIWTHGGLHSVQEAIWKSVRHALLFRSKTQYGCVSNQTFRYVLALWSSIQSLLYTFEQIIDNKRYNIYLIIQYSYLWVK